MDTRSADSPPGTEGTASATFRGALRYWEPRRIAYNLVLAAVLAAWLVLTWPHFRPALGGRALLQLLALAAIANVAYCAAYGAEIAVRHCAFRVRTGSTAQPRMCSASERGECTVTPPNTLP